VDTPRSVSSASGCTIVGRGAPPFSGAVPAASVTPGAMSAGSAADQLDVDAAGVRDAAEEAAARLKRANRVRKSLTNVTNSADAARQEFDDMVTDVERCLAAARLPVGLRLQQLADLLLANLGGALGVRVAHLLRQVLLELDRELALADLPERVPGAECEGDPGDRDGHEDDDQDHLAVGDREQGIERRNRHTPRVDQLPFQAH